LKLLGGTEAKAIGKPLFADNLPSPAELELSLQVYLETNDKSESFNPKKHLVQIKKEEVQEEQPKGGLASVVTSRATKEAGGPAVNPYLELLNSVPEIAALGPLFKSCSPVEVTETECEYVVSCIKHIYNEHLVFQFNITNNMEDQQLENVSVEMTTENDEWEEEFAIPEGVLAFQVGGSSFLCMARPEDSFNSGSIHNTLKFEYKEVEDGEVYGDEGIEDEYELEDVEVTEADFMKPDTTIGLVEFRRQWESLGNDNEVVKKFSLGLDNLQAAVDAVIGLVGMGACEGSNVVADDARSHAVNLAGAFLVGGEKMPVLARAGVMLMSGRGVTLKIAVRSDNADINTLLCSAIR